MADLRGRAGTRLGVRITGIEDVLLGFAALGKGIQRKYLKAAVGKVSKTHIPTVKSLVARGPTGNLRRSVGVVVQGNRRNTTQTAVLGFRRGDPGGTNGKASGYHAYWIERGVKVRRPKRASNLSIPLERARKYPYLRGKVALTGGASGGSIFFREVNGFAGTGSFERWSDSTLPTIRAALEAELVAALAKAQAEAQRRNARGM